MGVATNLYYEEMKSREANMTQEAGEFPSRHIGPRADDVSEMAQELGFSSLQEFVDTAVPAGLRRGSAFTLSDFTLGVSEEAALARLRTYAEKNQVWRSFIGMGYHGCNTPLVILRNVFENPGWYTQYTPYQPEISQGRLEALLNYQTVITELTGLPLANASLLDEGTAAAEAMALCVHAKRNEASPQFFIARDCHPQTIAVVRARAEALGIEVVVGEAEALVPSAHLIGALLQYPNTLGEVVDPREVIARVKDAGAVAILASDLLALSLLTPPGELGADIAVGSSQRFGVPLGYGGPHAAFFACTERFKRQLPGRIVGVSKDASGQPALRLALQTREQHIRREKATSNICTAQVLLAVIAGMYATYHGPDGLLRIARRVHQRARGLAAALTEAGYSLISESFFDTITVDAGSKLQAVREAAEARKINLRYLDNGMVSIALDEAVTERDLADLAEVFGATLKTSTEDVAVPAELSRKGKFMQQEVFNRYRSESEFLRYVKRLESKDLSLCHSMIPLGSCTMKLNATAEMVPVTWENIGKLHPFAPPSQAVGYRQLFRELEQSLQEITGFDAVSLQPNAGSQGEYAGLLVIRAFHEARGEGQRNVCLIPKSAHGTNPASAVMAGFKVVVVDCDSQGNVDLEDLKKKAAAHSENVAALMVTYPSTHGVFESHIREITKAVHDVGGQVYMDGANLNALVGLVSPAELGMDVLHINLHKTFCIPHGGGGPGMGPIAAAAHLAPFLPGHPVISPHETESGSHIGPVSAAPWGSSSILPISWMFIAMMGAEGLTHATEVAILNANYMAKRLDPHYPVLYKGESGLVAHECIIDCRELKNGAGVEVGDIARRLMDYGFHAPTISWPVPGTMMIEPTESESKEELDRFCDALIAIRDEIRQIESGKLPRDNNPLKNAPHTAAVVTASEWEKPYSREVAAFPAAWTKEFKFWPSVGAIDAAFGDRNVVCTCEPLESYQ